MSSDFDGKVVAVTGASTGLGRAIAVEVASRGAAVVVVVVNYVEHTAEAEEGADLVRARGAEPAVVQADVADDDGCKAIAAAAQRFGRIDALFNTAGITKFASDRANLDAVAAEDLIRLYQVNVIGAFQMISPTQALLAAAEAPAEQHLRLVVGTGAQVCLQQGVLEHLAQRRNPATGAPSGLQGDGRSVSGGAVLCLEGRSCGRG